MPTRRFVTVALAFLNSAVTVCGVAAAESRSTAAQIAPATIDIGGEWSLATNCGGRGWVVSLNVSQAGDGSLTAETADALLVTIKPGGALGTKMKSELVGNKVTLALLPKGSLSVLELTGTVSGSIISGRIHHYTTDDCDFRMVR